MKQDFYPRPPRGGRRHYQRDSAKYFFISIHALREEGDETRLYMGGAALHFYPRPPRGGRLPTCERLLPPAEISIHALREEGDVFLTVI